MLLCNACRRHPDGTASSNSPFTAEFQWREAPNPLVTYLTEQISTKFEAFEKGAQDTQSAKQLAADLLWLIPPPGESRLHQQGDPCRMQMQFPCICICFCNVAYRWKAMYLDPSSSKDKAVKCADCFCSDPGFPLPSGTQIVS